MHTFSKVIFSQNLRFHRNRLKISQKQLSESLEVGEKRLRSWESHKSDAWPGTPELFKLSSVLGVSVVSLCCHVTWSQDDENKAAKREQIIERMKSDAVFMLLCYTLSSRSTDVIDATLSLFESMYLESR